MFSVTGENSVTCRETVVEMTVVDCMAISGSDFDNWPNLSLANIRNYDNGNHVLKVEVWLKEDVLRRVPAVCAGMAGCPSGVQNIYRGAVAAFPSVRIAECVRRLKQTNHISRICCFNRTSS